MLLNLYSSEEQDEKVKKKTKMKMRAYQAPLSSTSPSRFSPQPKNKLPQRRGREAFPVRQTLQRLVHQSQPQIAWACMSLMFSQLWPGLLGSRLSIPTNQLGTACTIQRFNLAMESRKSASAVARSCVCTPVTGLCNTPVFRKRRSCTSV